MVLHRPHSSDIIIQTCFVSHKKVWESIGEFHPNILTIFNTTKLFFVGKLYFCTVKKRLQIFHFLGLLLLYFLTVGCYGGDALSYYTDFSTQSNSELKAQKGYSDIFFRTEQTESYISLNRNVPRTSFKNQVNHFLSCTLASGLQLFAASLPYTCYPDHPILNFRKTDIIFPFHYFW